MTKIHGAQLIIVLAIILLVWNLADLDFNSFEESKGPLSGAFSNVLLILAMIVSIREMKKSKD